MKSERRDAPRLYAVIGRPVLHSRSPDMFRAAFEALSLEAIYTRLAADSAEEAFQLAIELGVSGLNVTAPFKDDAAVHVDTQDEAAQRIGAVNTVWRSDQTLSGGNTDWLGVIGALHAAGFDPAGKRALVLGAGGAGRAAAWALLTAEASEVVLLNRSSDRAQAAAERLGCAWAPLARTREYLDHADLLVSCLPVGLAPIKTQWLDPRLVVMDANYARSPLATAAGAIGCRVVDGLSWLLHQATAGFERLTGQKPPRRTMHAALRANRSPASNIALIGFMGVGKSTLGRLVADRLGLAFDDSDTTIERTWGLPISEIFAKRGEAAFRLLEKKVIERVAGAERTVFAMGGGAVLDAENRRLLKSNCIVIWLWAPLAVSLSRAGDGSRPLLQTADPAARAERLLATRIPLYAECADLLLGVANRSPEALAERICDEIRRVQPD